MNTGRKHTEETKKKMSDNSKFKGVPKSEEFKKHLSETKIGKPCPWNQITNKDPEKIRKTAETHTGMKRSEESRKNISESLKGKRLGEENPEFKGYWITPVGKFSSLYSASNELGISIGVIYNRCVKLNENTIKNISLKSDSSLSKSDIGKTWKEVGWSFETIIKNIDK